VDFLDHWQTLIAGLVGGSAAITAVVFALLSERRRRKREAMALRVALGAEIRQFALRAYEAHLSIRRRLDSDEPISVHQLDDDTRFPIAVIYPNIAGSLGTLEQHAHEVVIFYGQIDLMRDAVRRLKGQLRLDDPVDRPTAATLVNVLVDVCREAQNVLPAFAGTPRSENDAEFIEVVTKAREIWEKKRGAFFSPPPFKPGAWAASNRG
jgi:hypothetical protein